LSGDERSQDKNIFLFPLSQNEKIMKPKKSLGQNFLRDKSVLDKIIKSANLRSDDSVIEVGPGEGILTRKLMRYAGKVIAIELDKNLAEKLNSQFLASLAGGSKNKKIEIINGDILEINLPELIKSFPHPAFGHPLPEGERDNELIHYKVIANIPYYITSPIIQLFLETEIPPVEMILMVQKEVADRITARPGKMSILAVSVQYYARAEKLFNVPRTSFWPVPDVDSAVIRIKPNKKQGTKNNKEETKKFFRIVKAGFSSKRKTLLNNLSSSFHLEKKITQEKIKKAGIDPTVRAQELDIEEWKKLSRLF